MASDERLILESACDEASTEGEIMRDRWDRLKSTFGERFDKAWRLVAERRVKRYTFQPSGRTVWIVVGRDGEYQVLPRSGYCGCDDFYFRIIDKGAGVCYHFVAQKLAEALNSYEEIVEDDEFFEPLMEEWRRQSLEEDSED